jgi:eukaryotic-like serine/threonine-protein kinase
MKSAFERQFGEFRLDLRRGVLLRNNAEVKLRPKAFEALRLLVESEGRLVSKAELMESLWPGTAVTEDSLAHCIMEVRRALGEEGPKLLRTVTGRGYLFEAPTEPTPSPAEHAKASAEAEPQPEQTARRWPRGVVWALPLIALVLAVGVWRWREGRAGVALARFEDSVARGDYASAFEAAQTVLSIHPAEDRVLRLLNEVSDDLTIHTNPAGAEVEILRPGDTTARSLGVTPIDRKRVARADYIVRVRKPGFVPLERLVSSALPRSRPIERTPWDLTIDEKLMPAAGAPAGMIPIAAHKAVFLDSLENSQRSPVDLEAFWLDRYEVTNEEFQRFVDAGNYPVGYLDSSGLPGPAFWSGGRAPQALSRHPVTGVSWAEAQAYCRSVGKNLPTAYQWELASRVQVRIPFGLVFPWGLLNINDFQSRANLQGSATSPVGSYPFGLSTMGAYDMAGNVREWLLNRRPGGRGTAGASWRDQVYQFLLHGWAPETTRADDLGFRCALGEDKKGAIDLNDESPQVYPAPLSTKAFEGLRAFYEYPSRPLAAQIVSRTEGGVWTREEIRFRGAGDDEVLAYLYLPKHARAPYQTIHFLGGSNWFFGAPITDAVEGPRRILEPYIRSGRAVFMLAFKGMRGRSAQIQTSLNGLTPEQVKAVIRDRVIDMRRGVDYLQSRRDVDGARIVLWNHSTTEYAVLTAANEPRYRGTLFVGAGIGYSYFDRPQVANAAIFAPFVPGPKLVINGRYDETNPDATVGLPFFNALRAPKKRVLLDDGHIPDIKLVAPIAQGWLDDLLGPVAAN